MRLYPAALLLSGLLTVACSSSARNNAKSPSAPQPTAAGSPVAAAATAAETPQASPPPSPTPMPLFVDAAGGNCPDGYPVKYSATGLISIPNDGGAYRVFPAMRCYDSLDDAIADGGKVQTPTPSAAALRAAAVDACSLKLDPSVKAEINLVQNQVLPAGQAFAAGGSLSIAQKQVSDALSLLRVQDALIQGTLCDTSAADYLSIIKAYSAANVDAVSLDSQGLNTLNLSLISQSNQRIKDSFALLDQATAILKALPLPGTQ